MTQSRSLKYDDKPQTTHAITTDPDLAGSLPREVLAALKACQIAKQLKGDFVENSEFNQTPHMSYLPDETQDPVGQAAMLANVEYYKALCDKARQTHKEYLAARDFWQSKLNKIAKTVD